MIRGTFHSLHPLSAVGEWIYSYVCEETSQFVSSVLVRHPCAWPQHGTGLRKRCQLCWLHSSLSSTPTHSLIWDACVCPTTCFARWNGSKSSVRVKWFSCVSLTLVRYMLSPAELLVFMSSSLCYVVALIPWASTLFTDKPYWRKNSNKTSIVSIMSLCNPRVVIIRFRKKHPPTLPRCVMVWIAEDFVDKFTRNLVRQLFFLLSTL